MKKKKVFCGNICKIWVRSDWYKKNVNCVKCGVYLCGVCQFIYHNKTYCINCCLEDLNIKKDLKLEFDDMVYQLDKVKKDKKVKKTGKVVVNA